MDKYTIRYYIMVLLIALVSIISYMFIEDTNKMFTVASSEGSYTVTCDSYSMGYEVYCNNTVKTEQVIIVDTKDMKIGRIYIYDTEPKSNHTIIHRYLGAPDSDTAIMKGDANRYVEFVNVSRIRAIVTEVEYK